MTSIKVIKISLLSKYLYLFYLVPDVFVLPTHISLSDLVKILLLLLVEKIVSTPFHASASWPTFNFFVTSNFRRHRK